jgi:hypothetical protein
MIKTDRSMLIIGLLNRLKGFEDGATTKKKKRYQTYVFPSFFVTCFIPR